MKVNNFLKVIYGANSIIQKVGSNIIETGHNLIEDKIFKSHYVTREEFENVKSLVIKLQQKLSDLENSKEK